jgi:hypothetical protein
MSDQINEQVQEKKVTKKVAQPATPQSTKKTKEQVAREEREEYEIDHQMFQGRFRYIEKPGQTLSFRYKKYRQDEYREWHLQDGETYTLPRFIINHINNNVHYMKYQELPKSAMGGDTVYAAVNDGRIKTNHKMFAVGKDPRCEFMPLEFLRTEADHAMMPNKLIQVVSTN